MDVRMTLDEVHQLTTETLTAFFTGSIVPLIAGS